jgi:hypothetical protein
MTMISAERMKSVRMAPDTIVLLVICAPSIAAASALGRDGDLLPDLLGTLEAQVGATQHEQGGEQPRQELAEQQGAGRMKSSLLRSEPMAMRLMIGSSRSG